jgi:hypothetical protein
VTNTTTTTTAPLAGVRIERFAGALNGWRDASPAVVDAATAARRLRLYRAVRGDTYIYRGIRSGVAASRRIAGVAGVAGAPQRDAMARGPLPVLPARRIRDRLALAAHTGVDGVDTYATARA